LKLFIGNFVVGVEIKIGDETIVILLAEVKAFDLKQTLNFISDCCF
jgi:hypothetical protein